MAHPAVAEPYRHIEGIDALLAEDDISSYFDVHSHIYAGYRALVLPATQIREFVSAAGRVQYGSHWHSVSKGRKTLNGPLLALCSTTPPKLMSADTGVDEGLQATLQQQIWRY